MSGNMRSVKCGTLWAGARLAGCPSGQDVRLAQGVVAESGGRILYAGPAAAAPPLEPDTVIQCDGRLITPGLIDCHTHLVYGGHRAHEFERRLQGVTYSEIAREGGGILSTVAATRAASETALLVQARLRLEALLAEGVTTIEIKSGYGMTLADEMKMLRVIRRLGEQYPVRVRSTFLGAHAVPEEFRGDADRYIDHVCNDMLPAVAHARLADAVDGYCESIAFSAEQIARVFDAASRFELPVKIHAEQLSDQRGALMAAGYRALSADHLEYLGADGVAAMARSGMVATLLPGAFYFTHEQRKPPVRELIEHGVPIAIATDCNPGTSPMTSLLLAMNMAATLFGLPVDACLRGVTVNAARALGLADELGTLEPGKRCDLAIWDVEQPSELVYRIGFNPLHARVFNGRAVEPRPTAILPASTWSAS